MSEFPLYLDGVDAHAWDAGNAATRGALPRLLPPVLTAPAMIW